MKQRIVSLTFILLLLFTHAAEVFAQINFEIGLAYTTDCKKYKKDKYFEVKEFSPGVQFKVFSENAMVYCSPDENVKVIDSLHFNATVIVEAEISKFRNDTIFATDFASRVKSVQQTFLGNAGNWYKITSRKGSAFVKKDDLAMEDFSADGFLAGVKKGSGIYTIELRSIEDQNKIKDTITFRYRSHGYKLSLILLNALTNSGSLISYKTFRQSCPGSELYEFVAYKEGRFTKLLSSYSEGEGGEYVTETIYLPLKFGNGKILLVANGDWESIFNVQTATLNTFPFPAETGIPEDQLVVRQKEFTEVIMDENGEAVMEDEYNVKVKIIKDDPEFYRWDGNTLVKMKDSKPEKK